MLIIENYRFSVGNVCLHPTFPKLPISIAVMSHSPACFRQRWPLCLWTACCCREGWWRGTHVGTGPACVLHVPQSPWGCCSHAGSACAPYPSWVPAPTAGCLGSARVGDSDGCHLEHRQWLLGLSRGTVRAVQVSPVRELRFPVHS